MADESLFSYYYDLFRESGYKENRWEIPLTNGQKLEIKRLKGPGDLKGLVLAEIKFNNENAAQKFHEEDFPVWFRPLIVKEVTDDPRYNGKSLAVCGMPNPR